MKALRFIGGLVLLLVLATACSSGGSKSEPATSGATTTAPVAATTTEPEPAKLTHRQFIHKLDRLCRVGNRAIDRVSGKRFGNGPFYWDTEAQQTAYARMIRVNIRFNVRWEKRHGFLTLDPASSKDAKQYRAYLDLSKQMRVLELKEARALLKHDVNEATRLDGIVTRLQNKRTRVTSSIGLQECGS
jgi:hypothetical protein